MTRTELEAALYALRSELGAARERLDAVLGTLDDAAASAIDVTAVAADEGARAQHAVELLERRIRELTDEAREARDRYRGALDSITAQGIDLDASRARVAVLEAEVERWKGLYERSAGLTPAASTAVEPTRAVFTGFPVDHIADLAAEAGGAGTGEPLDELEVTRG